jgi:hypothetical protein
MKHRMAPAAIEVVDLTEEPLITQAGDLLVPRHDGNLQLSGQNAALELARGEHLQRQLDGIVAAVKALDRRGDRQLGMRDDAVRHSDRERAAQLLAAGRDVGLKTVHGGKELAGPAVNGLTVLGQAKTSATALTQPQSETGLEVMHMGADGRFGDIEQRLGSREAAAFGDSGKYPQKAQIGIAHPSNHRKTGHRIRQSAWRGYTLRVDCRIAEVCFGGLPWRSDNSSGQARPTRQQRDRSAHG